LTISLICAHSGLYTRLLILAYFIKNSLDAQFISEVPYHYFNKNKIWAKFATEPTQAHEGL
jgi:hypothetical protein